MRASGCLSEAGACPRGGPCAGCRHAGGLRDVITVSFAQAPAADTGAAATVSPATLDQLVGPIALCPDDLVAIILPAATYPVEIGIRGGQCLQIPREKWRKREASRAARACRGKDDAD
ncbi:DUF3300 domain-containing protein [Paraburkholderia panacisoli]|uniref:DUF3300 domain-containing protein n=1 Tax=Paraburkholderia panacisoli TaxID=2603818 RepID=A0A5B0HDM7_9BURK|nr:DUF3300 domain-containing protein [Paraburkholderia panacisoli]KAA1013160.1 DUF3300 domain-containing protein [Paraburkholderia panacisoli]